MRNSIEESLDVELFDQMIRNGAFQGPEFYNLVNYIFDTTLKLEVQSEIMTLKILEKKY